MANRKQRERMRAQRIEFDRIVEENRRLKEEAAAASQEPEKAEPKKRGRPKKKVE